MSKKIRGIDDFKKEEKIKILRTHGWYELRSPNNWVDGANIPKNWKGYPLNDAFKKFYENNKKLMKIY